MVRSDRAAQVLKKKADDTNKAVAELSEIETSLRSEYAAVASARAAEEEFALGPREDGSTGALESDFKDLLAQNHINTQAYWAGTVVGPDARRFLDKHVAILGELKEKIELVHGSQVADNFYWRFSTCLGPLAVVAHLTRKVEMLSELELTQLEESCALFVASFRLAFHEHIIVTPKQASRH